MKFFASFVMIAAFCLIVGGCGGSSRNLSGSENPQTNPVLKVTITGVGDGRVVSAENGFECAKKNEICEKSFKLNNTVTLRAIPNQGYLFLGWHDGTCRGKTPTCEVLLSESKQVKAAFVRVLYVSRISVPPGVQGHFSGIWVQKTDGSEKQSVIQLKHTASFNPVWSPDGTKIAYVSNRRLDGTDQKEVGGLPSNIWVKNLIDQSDRPITDLILPNASVPQWSPDGDKIIYDSNRALNKKRDEARTGSRIWIVSLSNLLHSPLFEGEKNYDSPRWSADGKKIFVKSYDSLELYQTESAERTTLLQLERGVISKFELSPDENQIYYLSTAPLEQGKAAGVKNLSVYQIQQKTNLFLTRFENSTVYDFAVSPVSNQLVYQSDRMMKSEDQRGSLFNLWWIDQNTKKETPLTELVQSNASDPQFSPDGKKVLYYSNRDLEGKESVNGDYNLCVADLETRLHRPMTPYSRYRFGSFRGWSEDGREILLANESNTMPDFGQYGQHLGVVKVIEKTFEPVSQPGESVFRESSQFVGKKIVYSSYNSTHAFIREFDPETRQDRILAQTNREDNSLYLYINSFSVSPDQKSILYYSNRNLDGKPQKPAGPNLWIVDRETAQSRPLTELTKVAIYPLSKWSPDGKKIYYISDRSLDPTKDEIGTDGARNVWVVDLETNRHFPITQFTSSKFQFPDKCEWTRESEKLVCRAYWDPKGTEKQNSSNNLWMLSLIPKETPKPITELTNLNSIAIYSFVLSPDGSRAFYISHRNIDGSDKSSKNNVSNLWEVDLTSFVSRPVTRFTASNFGQTLQISADKKKLFYSSNRLPDEGDTPPSRPPVGEDLWEMNLTDFSHKRLTRLRETDSSAPFFFIVSPDQKQAYAERNWSGNNHSWNEAIISLTENATLLKTVPVVNYHRFPVEWISENQFLRQQSVSFWRGDLNDLNLVQLTSDKEDAHLSIFHPVY